MPRKISVKRILELNHNGLSGRDIVMMTNTSRNSVAEVLRTARELKVTWEDIKEKEKKEAYEIIFPDKFKPTIEYSKVDYDYVHSELKKVGVTLKMLWSEYVIECQDKREFACGYDKFCRGYNEYVASKNITSHIERKPGITIEVDWSGPTMSICDRDTGEILKVYLFVATLPYSQFSYVEGTLSMDQTDWLNCHVHMFKYFGGVAKQLVCDNLKTGVIKHPREGEIVLNESYLNLAEHYGIVIMPTGVKKPKEKASVEGTVGKIATAIIASLRDRVFYSLYELNLAIRDKLKAFNEKKFQKREGSRTIIFNEVEKPLLNPLPKKEFEIAYWSYGHKVAFNCHVNFKRNLYSVPYIYISKQVDIKYSANTVEIYYEGERIATHPRFPDYLHSKYSTIEEHMPDNKKFNPEWTEERIINWAKKIGPNTAEVIQRIFSVTKIKEQSFNPALAVLRLSKTYSDKRLENACEYALRGIPIPRYHNIKAILNNKQYIAIKKDEVDEDINSFGMIRGSEYYGGLK